MHFWDRYGVWIVAYICLLYTLFGPPVSRESQGDVLWGTFLRLNLMISAGVGYQALLRAVPAFGTWAPLFLRWIARLMLYAFLWCFPAGMLFAFLEIGDTPPFLITIFTLSAACVGRHILHDVRKRKMAALIG
jgi:hypothetical protein